MTLIYGPCPRQNGPGAETFPNGESYTGNYKNGTRHGKGEYHFSPSGKILDIEDGKLLCMGLEVLSKEKGKKQAKSGRGMLVGQWKEDLPHGRCRYDRYCGHVYDGDWQAGKPHGTGKPWQCH